MHNQLKLMTLNQLHSELVRQRDKLQLNDTSIKIQGRLDLIQSELNNRGETLMSNLDRVFAGDFYVLNGKLIKARSDGRASDYNGVMHRVNLSMKRH